jgi:FkbH-like protein
MKFLEASRLLRDFQGGRELSFLLGASGTTDGLVFWVRAAAAARGYDAKVRTLPFNTLAQAVRSDASEGAEAFVLLPWDLLPELDWRSGVPTEGEAWATLGDRAREVATAIAARPQATTVYLSAPVPPLGPNADRSESLHHTLAGVAAEAGARVLPERFFSLEGFFRSGSPFATDYLWDLANIIVDAVAPAEVPAAKLLVTDFDNTLWHGVVGEDGPDGVKQEPDGSGFPHFVYQTYLRSLARTGVLLAGVTRNDRDLAVAPLGLGSSVLRADDFVSIIASYHAKSAQIRELAQGLNLGLEAIVFVDDNPVELAEVEAAIPEVTALRFPEAAEGLPGLLGDLARAFHRTEITQEDRKRTELYRARQAAIIPVESEGADIQDFLRSLEMRLSIHDRSAGDRTRAVQLINKTNQFNLNGVRRSDEEVEEILAGGGRLLTASLSDRHGEHGEILSYLMDSEGVVRSFVLSCRVFRRRVEHAFLAWVADHRGWPQRFEYAPTPRNEPFQRFLDVPGVTVGPEDSGAVFDRSAFEKAHGDALELFQVEEPEAREG